MRRVPRHILGSFTCRKATTWDQRLYFPSEGKRTEDFFARKIRRLRPGLNPRTWVPKASTLPPDHRSRSNGQITLGNTYEMEVTRNITLNGSGCKALREGYNKQFDKKLRPQRSHYRRQQC